MELRNCKIDDIENELIQIYMGEREALIEDFTEDC